MAATRSLADSAWGAEGRMEAPPLADSRTASSTAVALPFLARRVSLRVETLAGNADVVALVLLPFVLLITTPSWSYLPAYGNIDPYIYTGFFQHLHQFLNEYSQTYYASRLPWLLVGNAAYTMFAPETANLLLRFLLFYVSVFSLYGIVRLVWQDRAAATLSAVALAVHVHFLFAIRWDYVDGPGIAGLLLTSLLLTNAATRRWAPAWLFGAGFAAVTTVSTQLFLVSTLPSLAAWYLLLNFRNRKHSLVRTLPYAVAGAVAAFVFFGLINNQLNGQFNYLQAQIDHVRYPAGTASYNVPFELWSEIAGWLVLPMAAVLVSVSMLLVAAWHYARRRAFSEIPADYFFVAAAGLQLLFVALVYIYSEFLKQSPILQLPFYASYLIPLTFIVLGGALATAMKRLGPPWRLVAASLGSLVLLAPFILDWKPVGVGETCTNCSLTSTGLVWALTVGGILAATAIRRQAALAFVAVIALAVSNPLLNLQSGVPDHWDGSREISQLSQDAATAVSKFNGVG
jgi:hypothetical protein